MQTLITMAYIRQPLKGIPIRYKVIKSKLYAYQRIDAYRDKETGKVHVTDRYLGPRKPARLKPMLDQLDKTDAGIITEAWQRGESMDWIQTYLKTVLPDVPGADTIYKWFRKHAVTRGPRTTKRVEKRIMAVERKAKQARRRERALKEIQGMMVGSQQR